MKKNIYNFLLIILILAAIIVGIMIFNKYYKEIKNEEQLYEVVTNIENDKKETEKKHTYKGYDVIGIIEIPKIKIKYPILSKTTEESMLVSVTKFWGPNVNEIGNITIAGHNNFSGTMFGKTKQLEKNDIIKLTDLKNNTIEYKVFDKYSIEPNDVSCVESVEEGTREVTLLTCTKGHKERLIIKAREDIKNKK